MIGGFYFMSERAEKEIMNLLTEFLVINIDEKVLQGISYIIVQKSDVNAAKIKKYDAMRVRLTELGVPENEQFRRYDVNTAIVYEIELKTAITITEKLSVAVGAVQTTDFGISRTSLDRQQDDIRRLAQLCVKKAQRGVAEFDVCLFSKNKVDKINITARDSNSGKMVAVTYDAFALRHTDILAVNTALAACGLKIVRVLMHEAVPSMTGVRATLGIVAVR